MKKIISYYEQFEGGIMPPWYYGTTYKDWYCCRTIYHIIPFNYIVRFGRNIKYLWDRFRGKPSYIDQIIEKKIEEFYKRELIIAVKRKEVT